MESLAVVWCTVAERSMVAVGEAMAVGVTGKINSQGG